MGLERQDGGAGAPVFVCLLRGGQKGPFADESRLGVEQVVDGLEAQVAHGHGIDLGIDQGDGKPGAPLPHHRTLFLGQELLQVSFDFRGHERWANEAWIWRAVPTQYDYNNFLVFKLMVLNEAEYAPLKKSGA